MIEPNRLTAPGETAARARVEAVFERLDALGPDVFLLVTPRPDLERRPERLAELEAVAARFGRTPLLREAGRRVRDGLLSRPATRNVPIGYGQALFSSGSLEDQVAREIAIEDAVAVAVVEDVLDPEVAAALAWPGRQMLGLPARSDDAERFGGAGGGRTGDPDKDADRLGGNGPDEGAPDDDAVDGLAPDEAASDGDADAAAEAAARREALRQRRAVLFVGIAAIAMPIAYVNGMGLAGLALIAGAAAAIAWLFADA